MQPEDVARDDHAWGRYVHWLTHFEVVQDRVQAMLPRPRWAQLAKAAAHEAGPAPGAPETFTIEQRLVVIAWTWPDRTFSTKDAYERSVDDAVTDIRHDKSRGGHMSLLFGSELAHRMLRVAAVTGHTYEDVYLHLLVRTDISAEHLELLLVGGVPVDMESLMEISEALQLFFAGGWRIRNPRQLEVAITRSVKIFGLTETLLELPLDALDALAAQAEADVEANADAWVNPQEFQNRLMHPPPLPGKRGPDLKRSTPPRATDKYRPLFDRLDADDRTFPPPYTFDEIDALLRDVASNDRRRTQGLPDEAGSASWWGNGSSRGRTQVRAWQAAGYRVGSLDLVARTVTFEGLPGRGLWWPVREELRNGTYKPPMADAQDLSSVRLHRARTTWQTRAGYLASTAWQNGRLLDAVGRWWLRTNPDSEGTYLDVMPDGDHAQGEDC